MRRGKFIVIDGGEGAGKTTILNAVGKFFGKKVLITHEPGGTPYAEEIRNIILHSPNAKRSSAETQFGLLWAQRADHIKNLIEPALKRGINVISDRLDSSTFAYQIYAQECKNLKDLFWKTREVFLSKTKPDHYIFFDVMPKVGLRRAALRKGKKSDHFDKRKLNFHKRVRQGFKEFLKHVPHKIIDANKFPEEVKENFIDIVNKIIK